MLEELTIHDFALIDKVHVRFESGFNVLSGETGAGKSILIGAIGFLLGGKPEVESIRSGCDECVVTGVLKVIDTPSIQEWFSSRDIPCEDGSLIIRRNLRTTGRGTIYVNSVPVLRQDLLALTKELVDMHGQHEHESLLAVENHRKMLDRYALIVDEVNEYTKIFSDLTEKRKLFEKMVSSEKDRAREIDILEYSISEIKTASLQIGEDEVLLQEEIKLSQHEKLSTLIETVYESLHDTQGVLISLRKARQSLEHASSIDGEIQDLSRRLDDSYYEIEDIASLISRYKDTTTFSAERMEEVESRLSLIKKMQKKYGDTIPEVLQYVEQAEKQLDLLKNWETDRETLESSIKTLEKDVFSRAKEISLKRTQAAEAISNDITAILRTLGMSKAIFRTGLGKKTSDSTKMVVGPYGFDVIEFLIAPNEGEGEKPLAKIASGGELSRVMLAIKTVLARSDSVETLIFDEIDTGIGGEIAQAVATHISSLASKKQVFCITHLATIASHADNHIVVRKNIDGNRTFTSLENVSGEERVTEIARMLSGSQGGEASRRHAEELLRVTVSN